MNKVEQYNLALLATSRIKGLDKYNQIFLTTMVLRKVRHPEEGLTEITKKASETMTKRYGKKELEKEEEEIRLASMKALGETKETYGKKYILRASVEKNLAGLEEALEQAELPIGFEFSWAQTVKSVFDYLVKIVKVIFEIGKIKKLNDSEIILITDMYEAVSKYPANSLIELVEIIQKSNAADQEENPEKVLEDIKIALISSDIPKDWKVRKEKALEDVLKHLA